MKAASFYFVQRVSDLLWEGDFFCSIWSIFQLYFPESRRLRCYLMSLPPSAFIPRMTFSGVPAMAISRLSNLLSAVLFLLASTQASAAIHSPAGINTGWYSSRTECATPCRQTSPIMTLSADFAFEIQLYDLSESARVYGISDVLTVPAATVPEPTSLVIFGLGSIGMVCADRFRRKQT